MEIISTSHMEDVLKRPQSTAEYVDQVSQLSGWRVRPARFSEIRHSIHFKKSRSSGLN